MKKIFLLVSSCYIMNCCNAVNVQDSIPALPKDVQTIEGIIAALYDVISGPAHQKRNWDRMRTLFLPESRMIASARNQDGSYRKRVMSVEDYISTSGPLLEKNGFFEKEIGHKREEYGSIAHIFSSYESRRNSADEKPFMRGINSIQLFNDGSRWWIVTVLWLGESPDNPIPKKYIDEE